MSDPVVIRAPLCLFLPQERDWGFAAKLQEAGGHITNNNWKLAETRHNAAGCAWVMGISYMRLEFGHILEEARNLNATHHAMLALMLRMDVLLRQACDWQRTQTPVILSGPRPKEVLCFVICSSPASAGATTPELQYRE